MNDILFDMFEQRMGEITRSGSLRMLKPLTHSGAYIVTEDGKRMLNFSGNDYLGLAARGDIRQLEGFDMGSTSSALLTGYYDVMADLEKQIAEQFGREAALIFNSGYHMNTGIVPALVDDKTLIVADKLVHASMIDGMKLSGVPFERFRHNDLSHLEKILQRKSASYRMIIVMVESVYSMDGDVSDLKALVEIKRRYPQVMLYVDEAHAVGVRGARGLGLAEETGTVSDIDLLCGTFGKALASMGAYVVCDDVVRRLLVNRCRPLIFSTALPPSVIAYTRAVWQALPGMQNERLRLQEWSGKFRQFLVHKGISMPSESHIIPWILGENSKAVEVAEQLQKLGYYVLPIRPPTVPKGTARLRFSLTAETPVDGLMEAIDSLI
ncbi:aminotransferase class I/II-fold pyridoxal phosphate-dependent enzyme [Porphyromonas macacae]|uniref:aminotransferase class I/II-fold pyridoxal phosphate-dependent enzyme n=1 Tax=Porphyromonas macacae TaxID=28115 RepID=UPI0024AD808F|nr:8-amino-7-oxononanoate synthase [Porphyromonas macacae]